jgi:hypothetical protein
MIITIKKLLQHTHFSFTILNEPYVKQEILSLQEHLRVFIEVQAILFLVYSVALVVL